WLAEGHRNPGGRYGGFAKALDAARTETRLVSEEDRGYEPGPTEREVIILCSGRDLDQYGRIAAAQGRALARQIDVLTNARTAAAALGLAAASRRLDDVLVGLQIQPKDAVTEIGEAYLARHRAMQAALDGDRGVADAA